MAYDSTTRGASRSRLADSLRSSPPLDDPHSLCAVLGLATDPRDIRRQAGGLTVRCPLHGGVSCSVTRGPDGTVRARCFGCGFTGDALGLVAAALNVDVRSDFRAVLREGLRLTGRDTRSFDRRPAGRVVSPTVAPAVGDETYDAVARTLLDLCSPVRDVAPDVARYLVARGVFGEAEAIGIRGLPPDRRELVATLLATFERADLERAGLLRPGHSEIDWPRYALLVPWRDRFGRITCVQRRRIDNLDDGSTRYRTPVRRAPKAPFGVDLLGQALDFHGPNCEVVFVEGALDCLARRRIARARNECSAVLGIYSASTPCEGLPLDRLVGRRVVLALDDDTAGKRACNSLGLALQQIAGELVRERSDGSKDWGEALVKVPV